MKLSIIQLKNIVMKSWCEETCSHDFLWKDKDLPPSAGHCLVTSLVVQDFFGGEIAYSYVEGNKEWDHYWNVIDGKEIDFTIDQFPKNIKFVKAVLIKRIDIIENKKEEFRKYLLLSKKVKQFLK